MSRPNSDYPMFTGGGSRLSRMRLQSMRREMVKKKSYHCSINRKSLCYMQGVSRRRFNSREQGVYRQRGSNKYIYQEAPADRVQREYMND